MFLDTCVFCEGGIFFNGSVEGVKKRLLGDGLQEIAAGAVVHGVLDVIKFGIAADNDDGGIYARGLAALDQAQARHAVHPHIGYYDLRTLVFGNGPSLQSVSGLVNFFKFVTAFFQSGHNGFPDQGFVVCNQ